MYPLSEWTSALRSNRKKSRYTEHGMESIILITLSSVLLTNQLILMESRRTKKKNGAVEHRTHSIMKKDTRSSIEGYLE